jgi:hypothetical protein
MSEQSGKKDLRHFLQLALAQAAHLVRKAEAERMDRRRVNRMRALAELIKEQVPTYEQQKANSRPPTGSVG